VTKSVSKNAKNKKYVSIFSEWKILHILHHDILPHDHAMIMMMSR
jgi:hypothetical protein